MNGLFLQERVKTLEELLALPYFEFLACMGQSTLHPGGLAATDALLRAADLRQNERVLEIGCGPGLTTQLLMQAGVNVTVVEPSQRMLDAALRNCLFGTGRQPASLQGSAEDLSGLADARFDVVLMESVFGFIQDKRQALAECRRVLAPPRPRICVVDVHYVSAPPPPLFQALQRILGQGMEALMKEDWLRYFGEQELLHWETFEVGASRQLTPEGFKEWVTATGALERLPGQGEERFERLAAHWNQWAEVFTENKRYLRGHRAVWGSRPGP
jgi:ubiquinone/menaquinone biosynthesis C-methylase UbiE